MEKNLQDQEAQEKLKKLVEEINVCMFITSTNSEDEHTRPMATVEVDDDGMLWYFTDIRSIKVDEVTKERDVHLVFSHPGKQSYLDLWGTASVTQDRGLIQDKWKPLFKAWFQGGVDDPNIALLKVKPQEAYYWDSEAGKMISFLKAALSAVTGKRISEGTAGKLSI